MWLQKETRGLQREKIEGATKGMKAITEGFKATTKGNERITKGIKGITEGNETDYKRSSRD